MKTVNSGYVKCTGKVRIEYVLLYGNIRTLYGKVRALYACTGMYGSMYVHNTYSVRILYVLLNSSQIQP